MSMVKLISLGLVVGSGVLISFGIKALDSFSSDISRFFTGAPTDKAVWLLVGGSVAVSVGMFGAAFFRLPRG